MRINNSINTMQFLYIIATIIIILQWPTTVIAEKYQAFESTEAEATYMAAIKGNAKAQYKVAIWHTEGSHGRKQSMEESFLWMIKAADKGHADAQRYVGLMFYYGKGVGQNIQESLQWLSKASLQGNTKAKADLANIQAAIKQQHEKDKKAYIDAEVKKRMAKMYDENGVRTMVLEGSGHYTTTYRTQGKKSGRSKSVIVSNCKKKWKDDYRMVKYCIDNQTAAKHKVDRKSGSIKKKCQQKWGTDFRMVNYCIDEQTSAKRAVDAY